MTRPSMQGRVVPVQRSAGFKKPGEEPAFRYGDKYSPAGGGERTAVPPEFQEITPATPVPDLPTPVVEPPVELKGFTVYFDKADHDRLRRYAFENNVSMQSLAMDAYAELFEKLGLGRLRRVTANRK
jgi:hypothetical protein